MLDIILTDEQALQSLQDSIISAENRYDSSNITFATDAQVKVINIALTKIIPHLKREDRIETLRILFGRQKGMFQSSKDMTLYGAMALRDRIYGPNALVDKTTPMLSDAVQGIREAYRIASGQLEMFK